MSSASGGFCRPSWQPFEDRCVRTEDSVLQYTDAVEYCSQLGGQLVTIATWHQAERLTEVLALGEYCSILGTSWYSILVLKTLYFFNKLSTGTSISIGPALFMVKSLEWGKCVEGFISSTLLYHRT